MTWLPFALIAVVFWTVVSIVDKKALDSLFPSASVYLVFVGLSSLGSILVMTIFKPQAWSVPATSIAPAIALGLLYTAYTYLFFRSLAICDAPVVVNLWLLVPLFSTFAGIALFGERLVLIQWAGSILVMAGAVLSSLEKVEQPGGGGSRRMSKAFLLMSGSALLNTLDYVIQKKMLASLEPQSLFLWEQTGELMGAALLLAVPSVRASFLATVRTVAASRLSVAFSSEGLSMVATFALMTAYSRGPLGLSTLVLAMQPTLVMLAIVLINATCGREFITDTTSQQVPSRLFALGMTFVGMVLLTCHQAGG